MISIDFTPSKQNKIFFNFYDEKLNEKEAAFKTIINHFKYVDKLSCSLIITGLEYQFDKIIDTIKPDIFYIKDINKGKWFVKELPTLFAMISNLDGILKISQYIDLFTEGEIKVILFDSTMNDEKQLHSEDFFNNDINGKFISIDIHSDSEVFEMKNYRDKKLLGDICHDIVDLAINILN
ncbi:hypothetical protein [Intestinibacter sp.]